MKSVKKQIWDDIYGKLWDEIFERKDSTIVWVKFLDVFNDAQRAVWDEIQKRL